MLKVSVDTVKEEPGGRRGVDTGCMKALRQDEIGKGADADRWGTSTLKGGQEEKALTKEEKDGSGRQFLAKQEGETSRRVGGTLLARLPLKPEMCDLG